MFREYDAQRDKETLRRLWREIGWSHSDREEAVDYLLAAGRAVVAEVNDEAEAVGAGAPGLMRYLKEDLPFWGLTAIAASRVARKQGLAIRLTARITAVGAAEGALVAGLGMFEQGFYDRAGFGTGSYEHVVVLDPATLVVPVEPRTPRRLTADDWEMAHAARAARMRSHGGLHLSPPHITRAQLFEHSNAFGLGYFDGPNGELTHAFWCVMENAEYGPYHIQWMAYQTWEQLMELMALIRGLGDQVRTVRMFEPPGIQMQDLLHRPFRRRGVSVGSRFETGIRASAPWQMRICDLQGCMARTHLPAGTARFNLRLADPIGQYLDDDTPWRGVGGDYTVTLGPKSCAERGSDPALPTLRASVGAFTRMWLGVRPPTGLAVTDDLSGPAELLEELEQVLCLPQPRTDLDF